MNELDMVLLSYGTLSSGLSRILTMSVAGDGRPRPKVLAVTERTHTWVGILDLLLIK